MVLFRELASENSLNKFNSAEKVVGLVMLIIVLLCCSIALVLVIKRACFIIKIKADQKIIEYVDNLRGNSNTLSYNPDIFET
jgi:hypothetical protein